MNSRPIFLVEDNPSDVALTERALRKNCVRNPLRSAADGQEAVEYLTRLKTEELPALVLMDLHLPKLDGLEVLRRIRSDDRLRRLPVVMLTSSREESDLAAAYDMGANSYIQKPVDFLQFTQTIGCVSDYWLRVNQPPPKAVFAE